MKAGFLTIAALSAAATALGHRGHRHEHKRRGQDVVYHTEVEYVTAVAPKVIVYVDQNGKPISTGYGDAAGAPAATPNSYKDFAPAPPPAAAPAPAAPAAQPAAPKAEAPKPAGYAPKPAEPAKASKAPESSAPAEGYGIVYSPYRDDGGCKTQDEVNADFNMIHDYSLVRIYGTDCNQVRTVRNVAKTKKFKIFAGIFNIDDCENEAKHIIDAVDGDWSCIDTVSVGNELVNNGQKSADQVVAAANKVRAQLKGAGYNGNIVIVDTFVAMIANPSICHASDYAAANCHAYFDGGRTAEQAGQFVADQAERVKQACGGKRVVITETGWPWQGATNGAAVASKANQKVAMDSIRSKFTKDVILFTAFDDKWKSDFHGSHGAEQYWGFIDKSRAPGSYRA